MRGNRGRVAGRACIAAERAVSLFALPALGRSTVLRIRRMLVLPAPLGPSSP